MTFNVVRQRLTDRLCKPLPGLAIQRTMARTGRIPPDYEPNPDGARASAVLLILTPAHELVYIRRVQDGSRHGGQIAFPGGAQEEGDDDLIATALRETEEEIGVPPHAVNVLGSLTPLYIPVTNYSVFPVVGSIDAVPQFVRREQEVDEVILVPVEEIAHSLGELDVRRDGRIQRAPCYCFDSVPIWGATAMMTAEFLVVWHEAMDSQ